MASLESHRQRRHVCFGNLFKRQRLPTIASPETFTSSDVNTSNNNSSYVNNSNNNSRFMEGMQQLQYSEDESKILSTPRCSSKHRTSCQRQIRDLEFDSDSNDRSRQQQRQSLLFVCFGMRFPRRFTWKKQQQQHPGNQTTKAQSKNGFMICDESVTDIPDSNITTRSAAIDSSYDGSSGFHNRRCRSRASSFYSAVSFRSDDDGCRRVSSNHATDRSYNHSDGCMDYGDDDDDFYSFDGDDFDYDERIKEVSEVTIPIHLNDVCLSDGSTAAPLSSASLCPCGFDFHASAYRPDFPLITGPGIIPDSHEECVALSNACKGCWETIVDRSETLDPQYRCIGLGMIKRGVMNRLAIPLTMFLEENDSIFHCWIHTPLGIRHMRSNLYHQESTDDDPDAGVWTGVSNVVDFSIPWYCGGKPVRALQQRRQNPKVGTSIETRCILPDQAEGKVMLFQFVMIPKGKTEKDKLKADRILKYMGPKKD